MAWAAETHFCFADAMQHLDELSDSRLDLVLSGTGRNADWIRSRFAGWPRTS